MFDLLSADQADGEHIMSNQLGHQSVSLLVPMARSKSRVVEPMQEDTPLCSLALEAFRNIEDVEAVLLPDAL